MQAATKAMCDATATGTMVNLTDTRNSVVYRVKKMVDGNCWMVDNLALDLTSTYTGKPIWGTAPVTVSGSTASAPDIPQQILNTGYNTAGGVTTYLYNWCAALADTSSRCGASAAATVNNTVINGVRDTTGTATTQPAVTGICPAPFRLPKGGPSASSSDKTTTANEFAKLDIAMGGTGANRTSANTYSLWMGTAAANTNWLGILGGYYYNGFDMRGIYGYWLSSTANGASYAYGSILLSSSTGVYPVNGSIKYYGFSVRCVL